MRHNYKSHGRHCYLRSFQSKCPKCDASVLYWECTHGSRVFFEYPPYGKLVRHICRHHQRSLNIKKSFPVIVKKPKGLVEKQYPSCPMCGRLFKNATNLNDHLENLKKNDIYHKLFFMNRIPFKDDYKENSQMDFDQIKTYDTPKFGKINIKKQKKIE
ncbi:MAG: hypothetical protein ACFFA4_13180 [Promethearchaeota archaeon]